MSSIIFYYVTFCTKLVWNWLWFFDFVNLHHVFLFTVSCIVRLTLCMHLPCMSWNDAKYDSQCTTNKKQSSRVKLANILQNSLPTFFIYKMNKELEGLNSIAQANDLILFWLWKDEIRNWIKSQRTHVVKLILGLTYNWWLKNTFVDCSSNLFQILFCTTSIISL